jgi:plastocyanin
MSRIKRISIGIVALLGGCALMLAAAPTAAPAKAAKKRVAPKRKTAAGVAGQVQIAPGGYVPQVLNISASGGLVAWVNRDAATHTATSDNFQAHPFDTGPIPGFSAKTVTFAPGNYVVLYHDKNFPDRVGAVVVGTGNGESVRALKKRLRAKSKRATAR